MKKTLTFNNNPSLEGMSEIFTSVAYSKAQGVDLKMEIICPWWDRLAAAATPKYPCIVFVQGCGWTFPYVWSQLPQLCTLSRRGYVVATITHRNAVDGHPYPACLQDVKTAIRYLRKHSDTYGIDSNRLGIWGTSSGGSLALLTAMTMDSEKYKTDEHRKYWDGVNFAAACFPPTDLVELYQTRDFDTNIKNTFMALANGSMDNITEVLKEMSPFHMASPQINLPPVFLAHGTADTLIPYSQSEKLYEKLSEYSADVTFATVKDAPHEGSFWSAPIYNTIFDFIESHI